MGLAKEKRVRARRRYLASLATSDMRRFRREWFKRLYSWARLIRQRTRKLKDEKGRRMPPAFDVIDEALLELSYCGESALTELQHVTIECLVSAYFKTVAREIDPRLHRLSNALSNYRKMVLGTHKPPS